MSPDYRSKILAYKSSSQSSAAAVGEAGASADSMRTLLPCANSATAQLYLPLSPHQARTSSGLAVGSCGVFVFLATTSTQPLLTHAHFTYLRRTNCHNDLVSRGSLLVGNR